MIIAAIMKLLFNQYLEYQIIIFLLLLFLKYLLITHFIPNCYKEENFIIKVFTSKNMVNLTIVTIYYLHSINYYLFIINFLMINFNIYFDFVKDFLHLFNCSFY